MLKCIEFFAVLHDRLLRVRLCERDRYDGGSGGFSDKSTCSARRKLPIKSERSISPIKKMLCNSLHEGRWTNSVLFILPQMRTTKFHSFGIFSVSNVLSVTHWKASLEQVFLTEFIQNWWASWWMLWHLQLLLGFIFRWIWNWRSTVGWLLWNIQRFVLIVILIGERILGNRWILFAKSQENHSKIPFQLDSKWTSNQSLPFFGEHLHFPFALTFVGLAINAWQFLFPERMWTMFFRLVISQLISANLLLFWCKIKRKKIQNENINVLFLELIQALFNQFDIRQFFCIQIKDG